MQSIKIQNNKLQTNQKGIWRQAHNFFLGDKHITGHT